MTKTYEFSHAQTSQTVQCQTAGDGSSVGCVHPVQSGIFRPEDLGFRSEVEIMTMASWFTEKVVLVHYLVETSLRCKAETKKSQDLRLKRVEKMRGQ